MKTNNSYDSLVKEKIQTILKSEKITKTTEFILKLLLGQT